jgi:replicative DNA helicase
MNQLTQFGKLPPQAIDLEKAVLGAIMVDERAIEVTATILKSDDFYDYANAAIYQACCDMCNKGQRIDFMTVVSYLKKSGELDNVGGSYYVTSLTKDVVTSASIEEHARLVKQESIKRNIIKIGMQMVNDGYDATVDAFDLHENSLAAVQEVTEGINKTKIKTIGNVIAEAIAESIKNKEQGITATGYSTGIPSLDRLVGGFSVSDYIIIAASTGEGKTTLALNIADHIASQGIPTAFFTFEMTGMQLAYKILSGKTETKIKNLRLGDIPDDKWAITYETADKYMRTPLYLNDASGLTVAEVCSIARALVKNKGLKVLFIDYLQLIKAGVKVGLREQEINHISKELRALSLQLDLCVVALSQLSRMEKGTTRMYQLSDLRESGAIEQDATNVIFVYKPILPNQNRHVNEMTVDGYGTFQTSTDDALIISAKNRADSTGAIRVKEQFWASRFIDYETQTPQPQHDSHKINHVSHATTPQKLDLPF